MASLESYGVDEYGSSNGVNLPDFTGCLLLATTPTPPAGTLVADGSEVSREAYAKLFAIFGTQYGAGDGVNTFALPDWRDEFPRFSGASRAVLTTQTDAIRNITGEFTIRASADEGLPNPQTETIPQGGGAFNSVVTQNSPYHLIHIYADNTSTGVQKIGFNAAAQVPTADENRPRNVAFLPCVIYV